MANICDYKIIVKGKKERCEKLVEMMNSCDEMCIVYTEQKKDEYELCFEGSCKWSVDCYCDSHRIRYPFLDEEIPYVIGSDYRNYTLRDKSKLLDVNVTCVAHDEDDYFERQIWYSGFASQNEKMKWKNKLAQQPPRSIDPKLILRANMIKVEEIPEPDPEPDLFDYPEYAHIKDLFKDVKIERGREIVKNDDMIKMLSQNDSLVIYSVKSSSDDDYYTVEVEVEDDLRVTCDCPDSGRGHYCKHMAAVLIFDEKNNPDHLGKIKK